MVFIGLTRLRIRFIRFVPLFALHTMRSVRQVKKSPGFQGGRVLADRNWAFWTMTAWDSQESMRAFMSTGAHKKAMPRLLYWCDESSFAHWTQPETALPSWEEADQRLRQSGRISKVLHPSPQHANMNYKPPRTSLAAVIRAS